MTRVMTARVVTAEGGFADVPADCAAALAGGALELATEDDHAPSTGVALRGAFLARDADWSVYSCGGLLVRTRLTSAPRSAFLLRPSDRSRA